MINAWLCSMSRDEIVDTTEAELMDSLLILEPVTVISSISTLASASCAFSVGVPTSTKTSNDKPNKA
jgi:hypothetical protein